MHKTLVKLATTGLALLATSATAETFRVTIPSSAAKGPFDGRVILILTPNGATEPRKQVVPGVKAAQIFGVTVDGLKAGQSAKIDTSTFGYPKEDLKQVPAGRYFVQAVLHRYDTYHLGNGKTVKLPAARGAGQNWRMEPGNLVSTPQQISFDPAKNGEINITLDKVNPPIVAEKDTKYIRHFKFRSEKLSRFWGRDTYITGHVLVPKGFDEHPNARYPLMVNHGHFPMTVGGFRTTPPDKNLKCEYSERFNLPCYNRMEQEEAYKFYQKWISDDFPRYLVVEIDHSNPYYDDSYAVNSENLGPYGDAITYEFIPALEKKFHGLGQGWARFLYGGSTGGWEALGVQVKYPDQYNGAFAACPDPIDFRKMMLTNIYTDKNMYYNIGTFNNVQRPAHRNYLGEVQYTTQDENHLELVLGDKNRSGGQWDVWDAVFSPMGDDGYVNPLWNKRTGEINPTVAKYWQDNYDLRHIMERDWQTLAPKLKGKIHIFVGDMDNYYLNDAVYLTEDFLKNAKPAYEGVVEYGDRAEHCWNGESPNALGRLHYNTMYLPTMLKQMEDTAPKGADLTSWKY